MPSENELRRKITDQIIAVLSDGTQLPPWRRTWSCNSGPAWPTNVVSGRPYAGVNTMLLELAARRHGLHSNWWGTFRQWEQVGGRVKKRPGDVPPGEWGTTITFCKPITRAEIDEDGEEMEEKFFVLRSFVVFNLDQVEGPFDHLRTATLSSTVPDTERRYEHADTVIRATAADIRHGGDEAYYSLDGDFIRLPHRHHFRTPEDYYHAASHECVHWTEHPARLNWDRSQPANTYAMGELIAEIGGCYLMGELGLPTGDDLRNHAAYLKHWLAGMQGDTRFIFRASAQASRAVDHILSYSRSVAETESPQEAAVV